jgi:glycosyltransferase involved in cell wall biosynthesis
MKKDLKFSCIILAFNESSRIISVLNILLLCPDLFEIIVVDDGSIDDTWNVLSLVENPKLTKIHLEKNV